MAKIAHDKAIVAEEAYSSALTAEAIAAAKKDEAAESAAAAKEAAKKIVDSTECSEIESGKIKFFIEKAKLVAKIAAKAEKNAAKAEEYYKLTAKAAAKAAKDAFLAAYPQET